MRDNVSGYADDSAMPNKPLLDTPEFPSVIPENINNQQMYVMLLSLHSQLSIATRAVNQLGREQAIDRQERQEMLEVFKTAKNVLTFIKFIGAVGTGILALIGVVKLT